jgi:hypothetical protein
MFSKLEKQNLVMERNLVRLHPNDGGRVVDFGNQKFQGVSTDLFFGLDFNDFSSPYRITRKLNISIAINPNYLSTQNFLALVTSGALKQTAKCKLHGDKDTGLLASNFLKKLLSPAKFTVNNVDYEYDSIGIACNQNYEKVSSRIVNDVENSSSHFEIKFQRRSDGTHPEELLCLNIHLVPEKNKILGQKEAIERLTQGINLFYAELGLFNTASSVHTPLTNLRSALSVTMENYESYGFSCRHNESLDVLNKYNIAKKYTVAQPKKIEAKPKSAPSFFSLAADDFPALSDAMKPTRKKD